MLEYRNVKTFLQKSIMFKIRSAKAFLIKKVKNTVPWTYVISDFNGKEIAETFLKKTIAKNKSKRV